MDFSCFQLSSSIGLKVKSMSQRTRGSRNWRATLPISAWSNVRGSFRSKISIPILRTPPCLGVSCAIAGSGCPSTPYANAALAPNVLAMARNSRRLILSTWISCCLLQYRVLSLRHCHVLLPWRPTYCITFENIARSSVTSLSQCMPGRDIRWLSVIRESNAENVEICPQYP